MKEGNEGAGGACSRWKEEAERTCRTRDRPDLGQRKTAEARK